MCSYKIAILGKLCVVLIAANIIMTTPMRNSLTINFILS